MVPVQPPMCWPPGYNENVKNACNHLYNTSKEYMLVYKVNGMTMTTMYSANINKCMCFSKFS